MCGIIGLAYDTISVNGYKTWLDVNTLPAGSKNFSFYLHSNPTASYMVIPGWDTTLPAGTVVSHNVIEKKYWALNLTNVGRGDTNIPVVGYKGVIDSGTSLLVGPKSFIDQLVTGIDVKSDCSNLASLPSVYFQLDDHKYELEGKDYVLQVSAKECVMGLRGGPFPESFKYVIMGDVFMRRYPSLFDLDKNTVSFQV